MTAEPDATSPSDPSDESARRRRRTDTYCQVWQVPLTDAAALVVVAEGVVLAEPLAVRHRALAYVCCALKGNGLSQAEAFAMADVYGLWDAFTALENDFVLNPAPERHELLQAAWRYEAAEVLLWALGQRRHLAFPDAVVDPAKVTAAAVTTAQITPSLRSEKEVLDAADIALRLRLLCAAADVPPAKLNPSVVYERAMAFEWLLGRSVFGQS